MLKTIIYLAFLIQTILALHIFRVQNYLLEMSANPGYSTLQTPTHAALVLAIYAHFSNRLGWRLI